MKKRSWIGMMALVALVSAGSFAAPTPVGDFGLLDHKGRFHQLAKYSDQKAVVVFVQGNSCPIVRLSLPALRELREQFADKNVQFLMINANVHDTLPSIRKEAEEFEIDFPIMYDETQLVAESLGVVRTGEVFLINPVTKELIYRGPIDDKIGYEAQKDKASSHYLKDALTALLDGKEVNIKAPEAKGCLVTFPTKSEDAKRQISYTKEVAPIVENRCAQCHIENGIGPFAMDSHKAMQGWGGMIIETILTKRMPPGQIDMEHGQWRDVHFLTLKEQTTLVHWYNAGAPIDGTEDPLTKVVARENGKWTLGEPDYVIELPPFEVPATGVLPQPSVTVPLKITEEHWVRAYEFNIEHRDACHHITSSMVMLNTDGSSPARAARRPRNAGGEEGAAAAAAERPRRTERGTDIGESTVVDADDPDAADPRGARSQGFAGYAPGKPIAIYPDDVGFRVVPGMAFRASLHYTTNGKAVTDNSRIGLYFFPKDKPPTHEIKRWSAGTNRIVIPPHAADHAAEGEGLVRVDSYLYNMQPHMHYRGKRVSYTAHFPDGRVETLLNVPNYSYLWQMIYTPKEPIFLPAGTKVVVSGAFDNSAMNPHNPDPTQEVHNGAQTWQEMFIGHMQVGPATDADIAKRTESDTK